ncbi:linoleate 9S-lipoxygenase-like isoform X2 [Hibiscus syriacus]|uniref:linoleate 9S-lipoxygenase-like isoform X2 n=1 Tax=Hibiscus syriacus TaxID=106335 RepID=UPI001924299A|nr:linoleate 9S-lipoxygenase-like isoform X2 [Hibiscus syriacus]
MQECFNLRRDRHGSRHVISGKVVIEHGPGLSGPGKSAAVQIHSTTQTDPNTGKGKLSEKACLKKGKSRKKDGTKITTYKIKLHVEPGFGNPGAFVIENNHKHRFFLQSATLVIPGNRFIHFDCRSWVYPIEVTNASRVFFSNTCYLPNQTPAGLLELRKEELESLRGDGTGERKEWERIYDYDVYDDLGNPEKGPDYDRPVLGGSDAYPYPRRGRTGRPASKSETISFDVYVPADERCSPKKLSEFIANAIQATAHFLLPEVKSSSHDSSSFESFDEIRELYSENRGEAIREESVMEKVKKVVPAELFKEVTHKFEYDIKFPLPQIIKANQFAWKLDEEFGRQMLAGTNPTRIRCLREFPPRGTLTESYIQISDIEENLDGLSFEHAMIQWRIYVLDHHDYLLPFLRKMYSAGVCPGATRTLLFLRNDCTLKPLAIELSYPGSFDNINGTKTMVILPEEEGTLQALWQLARAHVAVNDYAYHQLISHWLHTHAVVEPFIIATRRQLSVMHPVHRLLDPHFKDTMHINALARTVLINAGGILEKTLFTGKFSMELSSELYKEWRFDEQALPSDLIRRRMALNESESPIGAHILFQDYPYGLDGIDVWLAIQTWVGDFCNIFYEDDASVKSDTEIQAWWSEIRNVGHGDKRNETWWCQMTTKENLKHTLTTLIWITSALHASVNFGQYTYAGYPPNRPTRCRKFIPEEGTMEFAEFLKDPDKYFLNMLPDKFQATLGMALMEVLSKHTSEEVYLGQRPTSEWIDNKEVTQRFKKFSECLREIEKQMLERNGDPELRNRRGPAKVPYKLLYPDATKVEGITAQGIPNSVSI